jgi:predicted alpha/beta hydrolase family esterase
MTSTARALILDGWQHRRDGLHWQGWLAERLVERGWGVDYLTLPDPEHPSIEAWSGTIARALGARDDVVIVAHGLSVLLWTQLAANTLAEGAVRRALLVAPPASGAHGGDVSRIEIARLDAGAVRAAHAEGMLLVTAADDPHLPGGAGSYAAHLGIPWIELDAGAHLNAASGFGPWPEALAWCLDGVWPDRAQDAEEAIGAWIDRTYRPFGHRLGVLSAGELAPSDLDALDRAVVGSGMRPDRRHARLQPRPGERRLRAEDVADFAQKYGHEYQLAVIDSALGAQAGDTEHALESALRGAGIAVRWAVRV